MVPYKTNELPDLLRSNTYPGRGIVVGCTEDGRRALCAYFIMGRSPNSRNRILAEEGGALFTRPFDPAQVKDPGLIIYPALRRYQNRIILTNGDQTDTILEGLSSGKGFAESLLSRTFEPDGPNWTPRISALLTLDPSHYFYEMSLLKSADAQGSACRRYHFAYPALPGIGHFLHTYEGDGTPLPSFCGEPRQVRIPSDVGGFANEVWDNLDHDNRISLYVLAVDLQSGEEEKYLINKNH